jgi:hypothetical protein
MPTNTRAVPSVETHYPCTHFLYADIVFGDSGSAVSLGYVPAGAIIINAGVVISEAFNAGTTNVLDIGVGADADGLATDLALGTVGRIAADEFATTNDAGPYTTPQEVTATPALAGTAATTGAGRVYVEFLPETQG